MFRRTARRALSSGSHVFEDLFGTGHYEKRDPVQVTPPTIVGVASTGDVTTPPMYNRRRVKTTPTAATRSSVPDAPSLGQCSGSEAHVAEAIEFGRDLDTVVSVDIFPPGWLALSTELQAKAELGFGLHDDERVAAKQAGLAGANKSERARVYVDPGTAAVAKVVEGAFDGSQPVVSTVGSSAAPRSTIVNDSELTPVAAAAKAAAVGHATLASTKFHDAHQPFSRVSPLSPDLPPDVRRAAEEMDRGADVAAAHSSTTTAVGGSGESQADADDRRAVEGATHAIKTFEMGDFGGMYHWFGAVMGAAKELGVTPRVDMFFTEVTITLPLTEAARRLALFANLQENQKATRRNFSDGIGGGEYGEGAVGIPPSVLARIEERADTTFCWCLKADKVQRDIFMSEIFLQWFHRADYLMRRKSKEKKEYRENMTLEQVLKSASQNRRRRAMKREERDQLRKEAASMPSPPMVRAASKRAYMEANSRKPIGRSVNKGMAVPRHHVNSLVETSKARGKESIPRASNKIIGNPEDGGSAGDWIDLSVTEAEEQYEEDPESAAALEAQQDSTSFAARFAKQKLLKQQRQQKQQKAAEEAGKLGAAPSVVEVMPREMREEVDKDLDYDDGMQDHRNMRGTPRRFTNRHSTWY